jgi:hypothetical protein
MRRHHSARDFVFQDGPQDLQPGLPGQLFYLRLHLGPYLGHWQWHPHQQLLPSHHLELVLDLRSLLWYFFLTAALSFKRDSQPELYPSSGESRCFLFSSFN